MGLQLLQFVLKIFDLILQWYDQLICIRRARFGFKILNFKAADFFNFSFNKRIKSSNMSLLLEQDRAVKRSSTSAFELLLSIGSSPWSWDWMAARSRSISTLLFPLRLSPRLISSAFNSSVLRPETYVAGSRISCSEENSRCSTLTASELAYTRPSAIARSSLNWKKVVL